MFLKRVLPHYEKQQSSLGKHVKLKMKKTLLFKKLKYAAKIRFLDYFYASHNMTLQRFVVK